MRPRPLAAGLVWLVATTAGAAVVWVGLRPVLDTAVPGHSVPLSAADLRKLASQPPLSLPGPPEPGGGPGPGGTAGTTPGPAGSAPGPAGSAVPSGSAPSRSPAPSGRGTPSGPPGTASPTPTGGTGPDSTAVATVDPVAPMRPLSTVDGWTVSTAADGTVSYLRSFATAGGTAVITMVPGRVSLVSATPNADYTVRVLQDGSRRLVVQFLAANTADIVDAIWWVDHPYAEVTHL